MGRNRSVFVLLAAATLLPLLLMGAACQRTQEFNPIAAGCADISNHLPVCAYAVYGTFVIVEEQAAAIANDPAVPQAARAAIIRADEIAKPIADNLYDALRQYEQIRIELEAGKSTQERLSIAAASLTRWVNEAAPLVENLVKAVRTAKESKP